MDPEIILLYTLIFLVTLLIMCIFYIYHYLTNCQLKYTTTKIIGPDPIITTTNEKFHIYNPSIIMDNNNDIIVIARMSAINPGTCQYNTFLNYKNDYKANSYLNKFGINKSKLSAIVYWNYSNPEQYKIIHNYHLNQNNYMINEAFGLEDPRLFKFNNTIWVYAHYRGYRHNKFIHNPVIFKLSEPNRMVFLKYDKMTSYEKNWMPFEYNNELYFEYSIYPRVILKCNHITGFCSEVYNKKVKDNSWFLYKNIGGGAPPQLIPDKNIFLGIAHTRPTGILERKSFFYTFSALPPFNLIGTSNEFSIESNANIEFASGLMIKGGEVLVSCGIQDCYSRIVHYNLQDVLSYIK